MEINMKPLGVWLVLFAVIVRSTCLEGDLQEGDLRKYACEHDSLEVDCGDGQLIHFLHANYGRIRITVCNPHGNLDWAVNCETSTTGEIVRRRCDGRRSCTVEASNSLFGDPCPGTEKYLKMDYRCDPDPRSTVVDVPFTTYIPTETETHTYDTTEMHSDTPTPGATTPQVEPTTVLPAAKDSAAILYCNTQDLRRLDLVTGSETVLASGLNRSVVVDYDYARNLLVWTDSKAKSLFSAPLSGGEDGRRVLADEATSYGVAVDWVHGNVYWTDSGRDVIDVAPLDGSLRRSLFRDLLDEPRGIVLDPAEGYMYWSDWGEVPKIEKAGMDGTHRRVIVSAGLKWPNGLAIDLPARRLFWIEAFHENLCSAGLNGENIKKIVTYSSYLKLPFSIDIYGDWVYWTEWTSNKENIFKAHKITGSNISRVLDGETTLMGIKIYHSSKQESAPNVCGTDNGGCSHLCLPSPRAEASTNYSCVCPNGLELEPDGLNCSASPVLHAALLYCNRHDIRKYDLTNGADRAVLTGMERATVLDYHYSRQVIVWSDTDKKKLYSVSNWFESSQPKELLAELLTSYGVAVDWIHDNVYWTDTLNNKIDVARINGSMRRTLFSVELDEPRAIVLNPVEGWMYWSDWGEVPKIERSGMDGTHRRVIVSRNIRWPNGLAIDFPTRKLFWVDGKINTLSVVDLDGGNRRDLITSASVMRHPFSLDVHGDWLFWVEWSSGKESVFKAMKEDGSHVTKVFDGERTLMGLKVYQASKQPESDNSCGDDNGGCSHLCLPAPRNYDTANFSCACPNTMHMLPDNFSCSIGAVPPFVPNQVDNSTGEDLPVLLAANVDDIRVIDLRTYEDHLLIGDLTRAVAVDYHYANKTVVWTDIREDRICSAPIRSGALATELVNDCTHPDGLAVDWIHDNMYWTDKGKDAIGVARMDGSWEKTLFDRDLDEPRAIALDPVEGWMFWTDWGNVPKIERAGLDGSVRTVIVSRNIQWPNGVAIDLEPKRIYWADAKTHEICSSNYDGSGRRTILQSFVFLKQPFAMDIFKNDMYWVEWRSGVESIYKADKSSGANPTKVVDGRKWKNLMGIKVYHSSRQPPGTNRCGDDNGGCSHLCLPTPRRFGVRSDNYTCACPNNLILARNGLDCLSEREATTTMLIPTETTGTSSSNSTDGAILLYANKKDVRKMDLTTKDDSLLAENFTRASSIDFHYVRKLAVWTDYERGHIYSAPLWTGVPLKKLIDGNASSNGVAVDWIHDHIYWTDSLRNAIEVARLDGTMRRTLFKGGDVDQPRTIVLHPLDGWLFWTDWGNVPKIERAGMDGSNRKVIVRTGVDWTHALAIDLELRKIYWADGDAKRIFRVEFDGSSLRSIVHSTSLLHLPFSMDILKDDLYWTEFLPSNENIYRANKLTGANIVQVVERSWRQLMGIKIYHSSKQPQGANRCGSNNGGCSHLCLPTPRLPQVASNYTCICPNGMEFSWDMVTCVPEDPGYSPTEAAASTPATPANSSSPAVNAEGTTSSIGGEESGYHSDEATAPVGLIIGVISAVALVALVGVFVYYRHFLRRNLSNMIFNNPVYRKHVEEEFCIEKQSESGRKSLVPLTSAELSELE